ncbi:MAG TPA: anthranilate synthase component I family protein [Gemmatimonadaceae bacterium]|nr:anthranilate synthase component I family protein [Gemmatimonadaceae bacterium]
MTSADFHRRAAEARASGVRTLVPVSREILLDTDTPVSAFHKLRADGGPFAFLLESAPAGGETWARYTFMGVAPRGAWRLNDGVVEDWSADAGWHNARRPADPLADLEALLSREKPLEIPEAGEFWSGAVGYFSYDVVRLIERLPHPPARTLATPDALFVFTGALVIIDNLRAHARVVVGVPIDPAMTDEAVDAGLKLALAEIDATIGRLRAPGSLPPLDLSADAPPAEGKSSYLPEQFKADVERIREYIVAGDAFQVLLARRIEVPHDFSSETLYRALRVINPSPYMYHLVLDGVELVGSSPELLVRVGGGKVTVRPIAGTRRRGRTAEEDEAMRAELVADDKERAEHLMLVDLGRNDLGRIAEYGSVSVTDLMTVERYSHVLHMVSQVEGRLAEGKSAMDALRATFPAGTMTGAPKVRAMEIIDELEPERRGPYAGAVGYIAAGARRMDLAITIRTCVIAGGVASVQTGAGIVHDSVPEMEWRETENKARAVLTAIGKARHGGRERPGPAGPAGGQDGRQASP